MHRICVFLAVWGSTFAINRIYPIWLVCFVSEYSNLRKKLFFYNWYRWLSFNWYCFRFKLMFRRHMHSNLWDSWDSQEKLRFVLMTCYFCCLFLFFYQKYSKYIGLCLWDLQIYRVYQVLIQIKSGIFVLHEKEN